MELTIPTPSTFNFQRTVISHGWYGLLPFALDADKWELTRVIDVGRKPPVTIVLTGRKNHVHISTSRLLNSAMLRTPSRWGVLLRACEKWLIRRNKS